MGAGILPVAIYKNQLYFLFGKERDRPLETARGWADFGGGNDYKETNLSTAAREGAEELSGFLGNRNKIKNHLRKKKMTIKTDDNNYTTFIVPIDYDTNLPKYFNNQISFINEYVDNYKLNNTTMYEKQEIKWYTIGMLKNNKNKFREFYREIINKIILHYDVLIKKFKKLGRKKTKKINYKQDNKTKKNRLHIVKLPNNNK